MDIGAKFKAIRKAEKLTQERLAELIGVPKGTLKNIEQGIGDTGWSNVEALLGEEMFERYALWVSTNQICPECGQVSPSIIEQIRMEKIKELRKQRQPFGEVYVSNNDVKIYFDGVPLQEETVEDIQDIILDMNRVVQKYIHKYKYSGDGFGLQES